MIIDILKTTEEEIISSGTKSELIPDRREKRQVKKKENEVKSDEENPLVENMPLFVMLFMALLLLFKLIAQATLDLPPVTLIAMAMASAVSGIFLKDKL